MLYLTYLNYNFAKGLKGMFDDVIHDKDFAVVAINLVFVYLKAAISTA